MMHDSLRPRRSDIRRMLLPPELAMTDPRRTVTQLPPRLLGVATCKPLGRVSVNAMSIRPILSLGLLTAKVSEVVPFSGMLAAPKALIRIAGTTLDAGPGGSTGRFGAGVTGRGTLTGGSERTGFTGAAAVGSVSSFPLNFQCGQ